MTEGPLEESLSTLKIEPAQGAAQRNRQSRHEVCLHLELFIDEFLLNRRIRKTSLMRLCPIAFSLAAFRLRYTCSLKSYRHITHVDVRGGLGARFRRIRSGARGEHCKESGGEWREQRVKYAVSQQRYIETHCSYGFITYESDEVAAEVRQMTDLTLNGRKLNLGPAMRRLYSTLRKNVCANCLLNVQQIFVTVIQRWYRLANSVDRERSASTT